MPFEQETKMTNLLNKIFRHILFALIVSYPTLAIAEIWEENISVSYIFGDGDSRLNAEEIAADRLKFKASTQAGTYVETKANLKNGVYTENIHTLSSAMIKISGIQKKYRLNKSGLQILHLSAKVTIDEKELLDRVAILKKDKETLSIITKLTENNKLLRRKIQNLQVKLNTKEIDFNDSIRLSKKQIQFIRGLTDNESAVRQVFEKGTLLAMAEKSNREIIDIKYELQSEIYERILNIPIYAEIEEVISKENFVQVLVRVGWRELNLKSMFSSLSKYFTLRSCKDRDYKCSIRGSSNVAGKGPISYTETLYNYLAQKGVSVEVKLGKQRILIPAMYPGIGFMDDCRTPGIKNEYSYPIHAKAKSICFYSHYRASADFPTDYKISNPLKFEFSKSEAQQITKVEAKMILIDFN